MPTTNTEQHQSAFTPPPTTLPLHRDVWIARRFGLAPAVAKTIAELAFPPAATWRGKRA